MTRPLAELVDGANSALPAIHAWIATAPHPVEVLACEPSAGDRVLHALQVTTRSPLGALAHETGGLLLDHGWLRVLGAGSSRLPRDLWSWNRAGEVPRLDRAMLVADDAVGGFFALNGGAFAGAIGNVHYFAPDSLAWEDTERGYTDWLHWAITGDLAAYYAAMRWPGWEREIAALATDRALSIMPPLWSAEAKTRVLDRRAVPIEELFALTVGGHGA